MQAKPFLTALAAIIVAFSTVVAQAQEKTENRTLRKDRVWVYHIYSSSMSQEEQEWAKVRYVQTVQKNGKEYMQYNSINKEKGACYYLREESGRIYSFIESTSEYASENDMEYMVYDLNMRKGDVYESLCALPQLDRWELTDANFKVEDNAVLNINGTELKSINLTAEHIMSDPCGVMEQTGPLVQGTIGALYYGPFMTGGSMESTIFFEHLEDLDGNVIVTREDVEKAINEAGIREVQNGHQRLNGKMYDLNGREIRNPEPGTVYIQGGRKHVAPRR